ncbi:IclR family transcriptional regulator [Pluralibacter gergoviae]|uniref:IclR family transcriptional regulator n=1 Tax=Pluralibacter gergoviae TaxID=61647 RepID=UPI0006507356|nr:IclR family transcriptional regulator [Pluralibacter gergoviae]EKV0932456.1 IclR family transcriptional regulator [Pluralibacter gergoviae]EKV6245247.1 IclR family transcriptional regulator [Pluralibacter gergoviae]EKW9967861.1 IclR family transcriptional regulator [Pluralibacter gergoviae]ELD4273719.1 IclR family transcriptional regulator [Pluralibacter gergoviae]ELD4279331.1 IclR family transcriptional regulator [Pluralibacter gergoviae]
MGSLKDSNDGRASGIQVIARAVAVMRTLSRHPSGLSLSAIAQDVQLARSTVQRIVAALEAENMVESVGSAGGFRLGPALGQLLHQTQADIITSVREHLNTLSASVEESVCLCTLAGDKVYVVDCTIYERELRVAFPIGVEAPAYSTAAGKIMLSQLDPDALQGIIPHDLPMLTANTLSRKALLAQLAEIRMSQIADDWQEHLTGVCTFAVPLNTYLGTYAISIIAPSVRAETRWQQFHEALNVSKSAIESKIGSSPAQRKTNRIQQTK